MSKHEPKNVPEHGPKNTSEHEPPVPPDAEPPTAAGQAGDLQGEAHGLEGLEVNAEALEKVLAEEEFAEWAALRAELEDAKDRALRCRAEMENYKKRVARQVEEERRYANVALLRDLLPVLDNMGRAIQSAQNNAGGAGLLEGVQLVFQQLHAVFEKHDCKEISALHEPFDPNRHEAVSQRPSGAVPPGTVVEVVQPGFQMHDRVVRPSQVIVSTGPAAKETKPPS